MADSYKPDQNEARVEPRANDLKEWETPQLVVDSVQSVTRGGTLFTLNTPDDAYYS